MQLYLVYYPSFRDGAADELWGIYDSRELALKAIDESWYSKEDKKNFYIDVAKLNTRI